jgi:hypothetical protein
MKSFREFITEARGGKASEQAMRMGLVSDGHGGWVNRQGNLIAQTEKDRLVFIKPNKQQKPPAQQPAQKSLAPVTIPQEKINSNNENILKKSKEIVQRLLGENIAKSLDQNPAIFFLNKNESVKTRSSFMS